MVIRPAGGSAVGAVLDQMHRALADGTWGVGDRVPGEYELAERFGVSRPAIREAVRALAHIGVLEVRHGSGTYVLSTTDPRPLLRRVEHATLRDVFEVQLAYDVQAARLAARRRTDDDVARLHALLADRARAGSAAEFGAADARFHSGVVECAGNPMLLEVYRFFERRLSDSMSVLRLDQDIPEAGQDEHRAVVEAIADRDGEAAARAATAIVAPTLDVIDRLLTRTDPTAGQPARRAAAKPTAQQPGERASAEAPAEQPGGHASAEPTPGLAGRRVGTEPIAEQPRRRDTDEQPEQRRADEPTAEQPGRRDAGEPTAQQPRRRDAGEPTAEQPERRKAAAPTARQPSGHGATEPAAQQPGRRDAGEPTVPEGRT
ncbi:FCD domain-containing protein [Actinomadura atramentaria]|uniref:FCD domain-containing protein n=1 Tax=Actinomadura atramentaria TaxID=1990 RepID=UPI0003657B23|nr:FCD domain-containing protein [Actinomadura atramentaria]